MLKEVIRQHLSNIAEKLEKELLNEWDQKCRVIIKMDRFNTYSGYEVMIQINSLETEDEEEEDLYEKSGIEISELEDYDDKLAQEKIENFAKKIYYDVFY